MPISNRDAGSAAPRALRAALLLAVLCGFGGGLGGCASGGPAASAFASAGGGATVAFESIDGPPPQVFDRMVNLLDSESKLRNVAVVSRDGSASYRIKGYLAAQVSRGRATIAWVWDVYDRDQQRAIRLSGEEPAGKAGRDAWAAADDVVLRRIAQAGLTGLAGMINGTAPSDMPVAPAAPRGGGPAVASTDPWPPSGAISVSALSYSAR
jgi:hypothetical protein